jgi:hypothetical protein
MPEISEAEYWQLVQSHAPLRRSLDELLKQNSSGGGLPKLVSRDRVIEPEPIAVRSTFVNPLDHLGTASTA